MSTKKASHKKCNSNQILNPKTNRCVKKDSKTRIKVLSTKSGKNGGVALLSPKTDTTRKQPGKDYVLNPETGYWAKKTSKLGKYIINTYFASEHTQANIDQKAATTDMMDRKQNPKLETLVKDFDPQVYKDLNQYTSEWNKEFSKDQKTSKFKIFETNDAKVISSIKENDTINSIPINILNNRLKPYDYKHTEQIDLGGFTDPSREGFIKATDDIRKVLAKDSATVHKHGCTHKLLAMIIYEIKQKEPLDKEFTFNGQRLICLYTVSGRDSQQNPFYNGNPQEQQVLYNISKLDLETFFLGDIFIYYKDGKKLLRETPEEGVTEGRQKTWRAFYPLFKHNVWPKWKGGEITPSLIRDINKLEPQVRNILKQDNDLKNLFLSRYFYNEKFKDYFHFFPFILKNIVTQEEVYIHRLTVELIFYYGFYQNGPYRLDPLILMRVLGLA